MAYRICLRTFIAPFIRSSINVSLDYPSYSTDPNDLWNLATTYNSGTIEKNSSLIEPPIEITNMFMMMGSAILAVYLMLTDNSNYFLFYKNHLLCISSGDKSQIFLCILIYQLLICVHYNRRYDINFSMEFK
ncbi:transient receptor potential cation channel subfamily a member 1-like [Gigaspora margarita]|uniref:Transient receptor potential cation channel subfamily a member 1-like n=1 Tax=Gigaspora margarita TaxID=4874 RepID=A0A8H4ALM3_GIGMA|nr:transient receptor potential cation channel subfamily a member 1-like [Gigaspora margarita]